MVLSIASQRKIESAFTGNDITHNFFEDVDLVEEHTLLVVVHVTLAEHLNSTLGARLSMHAHTDLSESTYSQNKEDVRKTSATENRSEKFLLPTQNTVTYRFRGPCRFCRSHAVCPECVPRSRRHGCLYEGCSGW